MPPSSPATTGAGSPLVPALVLLTLATGLVDALSYLELGRVFVANMTGNIVFIGFSLAGADEFSVTASVTALIAFMVGSLISGQLGHRIAHRARLFLAFTACEVVLLAIATVVIVVSAPDRTAVRYGLIVLLAIAMGVQNAGVRSLQIPNLTTTVLTMAITGIAADGRLAGGPGSKIGVRGLSIVAMLAGATLGAFLIQRHWDTWCLGIATVLVLVAAALLVKHRSSEHAWATGQH